MTLLLIDSKGKLRLMNVQDILYLQTSGFGGLDFYAFDERFKPLTSLQNWFTLLQNEGFMQLDRGTIVNVKKISSYDPNLRVVVVPTHEGNILIPFTENIQRELVSRLYSLIE
ncbi:LytTR family transcriptional regulator DNA-binding domain-containing protein [Cohnella candidum]|nr:LytTR family transcriptional regulator DNA-binding domain-containing protein [Cohnella candidum]